MSKETSEFFVYRGNKILGVGTPMVITTITVLDSPVFKAEFYIFVEGREPVYYEGKFEYNLCKEPEDMTPVDKQFMVDEIYGLAKDKLYEHLYALYEKSGSDFYLKLAFDLTPTSEEDLYGVWFRGKFKNQIENISRESGCYNLKCLLQTYLKRFYILDTRTGKGM